VPSTASVKLYEHVPVERQGTGTDGGIGLLAAMDGDHFELGSSFARLGTDDSRDKARLDVLGHVEKTRDRRYIGGWRFGLKWKYLVDGADTQLLEDLKD
jgi:hypothetical protein